MGILGIRSLVASRRVARRCVPAPSRAPAFREAACWSARAPTAASLVFHLISYIRLLEPSRARRPSGSALTSAPAIARREHRESGTAFRQQRAFAFPSLVSFPRASAVLTTTCHQAIFHSRLVIFTDTAGQIAPPLSQPQLIARATPANKKPSNVEANYLHRLSVPSEHGLARQRLDVCLLEPAGGSISSAACVSCAGVHAGLEGTVYLSRHASRQGLAGPRSITIARGFRFFF